MSPKKKPAKKRRTFLIGVASAINKEAAPSVSLDGSTQFCLSCDMGETAKHTCEQRPMTAEERAVVEAAMDLELPREPWLRSLMAACRALRAARGK